MSRHFIVLCEGHDDQLFWGAWLQYLGARDLFRECGGDRLRLEARLAPLLLNRSDTAFENAAGDRILVRDCNGSRSVWESLRGLVEKELEPPSGILVNVDSDRSAADGDPEGGAHDRLLQVIREATGHLPSGNRPYQLGATCVDRVVWRCDDPAGTFGVPDQQCLERLVCAAIAEASVSPEHPDGWAASVRDFLEKAPRGGQGHKNYALSYFAKWFAPGTTNLFRVVWSRSEYPRVAATLEKRLRATGAWKAVVRLLGPIGESGADSL